MYDGKSEILFLGIASRKIPRLSGLPVQEAIGHTEAGGQPSKESNKNGGKGSLAVLTRSLYNWVVCLKITPSSLLSPSLHLSLTEKVYPPEE